MIKEIGEPVSPFLKWAGGKRWLAPKIGPYISAELKRNNGKYYEPFLGAGAIFFQVRPQSAILSDINHGLIVTYEQIRKNWLALVDELKTWPVNIEFYYKVRGSVPVSDFEIACRFLYLNRTCYGGIHRENKKGNFNVPYGGGRTHFALWNSGLLQHASEALKKKISLKHSDFESILNQSKCGDVVYCDPTYSTIKRKQFDRYGKSVFSWSDQFRLALAADNAMDRGVLVIISNSGSFEISQFYPRAYRINLERKKNIGNKASCNSNHLESLYILDPNCRRKYWECIGEIVNRRSRVSHANDLFNRFKSEIQREC